MKLSFPLFLFLTGSFTQTTSAINIAGPDKNEISAIKTKNSEAPGPLQFAVVNEVSITPCSDDGTIDGNTWKLIVDSPGAKSLNLGFKKLQLPNGAKMRIKDVKDPKSPGMKVETNKNAHDEYWSRVVLTDEIEISIDFPHGVPTGSECDDVELSSINVGFRGFGGERSGSCNVDVVCTPDRIGWEREIASVGGYSYGGSLFCTGAMINNMEEDSTPYFLTADHCGVRDDTVASVVTYWNYETSVCGGTPDGNLDQSLTGGGTIVGRNPNSDATLILLDAQIPQEYGITFAGWDSTPEVYNLPGVAIHHPSGDEKRISFEYDAMASTNYLSDSISMSGTHVKVYDWDSGTTEPGSSGSPLFNGNNRIIGQLHGGYAACSNDSADWYGRFSRTWADSPDIRAALDPVNVLNGGTGGIDSFDPYAFPTVSPRPTTSPTESPTRGPCFGTDFLLELLTDNYGNEVTWALTSQESMTVVANGGPYANNEAVEEYECIASGCHEFTIYDSYGDGICCSYGEGEYSITVDGVVVREGIGDYDVSETTAFCTSVSPVTPTESPISVSPVTPSPVTPTESPILEPCSGSSFLLELLTDFNANEVTWALISQESMTVVADGGTYANNEAVEEYECIASGCYEFTIYDSYGDGICCSFGEGEYSITVDGVVVQEGIGDYDFSETTGFCTSVSPVTPTESPTSETCVDSELLVSTPNGSTVGCDFVAANDVCGISVAASHCPFTCSACDVYGCVDSEAPWVFNGNQANCAVLAGLADENIILQACNIDAIASTCRETCNFCP